MAGSQFEFAGASGNTLSGRLEKPETTSRGWAIFAHCFTCGQDNRAAVQIARALARAGIGVLRFDFAGIGKRQSEDEAVDFAADVADLKCAAEAMAAADMPPAMLIGHSLGGTAVLTAAADLPDIAAVVSISAPADPEHVLHHFAPGDLETVKRDGEATVDIAGRPFRVRRSFVEAVEAADIDARVGALRRPLLVMHGPRDEVVGIDNASRIFGAAMHPKSFVSLDDADHLLSDTDDAQYAAATIAAWASRYLPLSEPDLPQVEKAAGVSAIETLEGRFQLAIQSGEHRLFADERTSVGGLDSGLSPYELVSAGLAACTVMTMRLYADRKGWPLLRAGTAVEHTKVKDAAPADRFTRTITLEGPLSEEQRGAILKIADRCPVDLTLVRGSDVQTTLADAPAMEAEPAEPAA